MLADTAGHNTWINVFWYGQNNQSDPARIKADLAASVSNLAPGNTRFVVLSVVNEAIPEESRGGPIYAMIVQLNNELAALYPQNYIDIRTLLVNHYDPAIPAGRRRLPVRRAPVIAARRRDSPERRRLGVRGEQAEGIFRRQGLVTPRVGTGSSAAHCRATTWAAAARRAGCRRARPSPGAGANGPARPRCAQSARPLRSRFPPPDRTCSR